MFSYFANVWSGSSDPTSKEFADSLGLSPGLDAPAAKTLNNEAMRPAMAIAFQDKYYPFVSEFGQTYLPCLLRTFFLNDAPSSSAELVDHLLFWRILGQFVNTFCDILGEKHGIFTIGRFATSPDGGKELLTFLIRHAERVVQLAAYITSVPEARELFDHFCKIITHFPQILATYIGYAATGSILSPAQHQALLRIFPKFKAVTRQVAPETRYDFETAVAMMGSLVMGVGRGGYDPNVAQVEALVGRACEAREKQDEVGIGRCVELAEDESFHACAKCLCVFYCGKAHQKAHWKVHKPVCFAAGF